MANYKASEIRNFSTNEFAPIIEDLQSKKITNVVVELSKGEDIPIAVFRQFKANKINAAESSVIWAQRKFLHKEMSSKEMHFISQYFCQK